MTTTAVFVVDGVLIGTIKVVDGLLSLTPTPPHDDSIVWEALGTVVSSVHNPGALRQFTLPAEETPT